MYNGREKILLLKIFFGILYYREVCVSLKFFLIEEVRILFLYFWEVIYMIIILLLFMFKFLCL